MEDNSNGGHRSAGSADSYIGSRISLTSKSEIRYEGILYSIDTENSNIALQDVMSFGTEGRKKDGPQIPRSDKVYDFIIFRGSDIKDLQVISSPSTQSVPTPHNDPAIISQSQYPQHAAPMAPRFGSSTSGNMGDRAPLAPYQTMSQGNFQSAMPGSMYQPWPGLPQTMTPSVNGGLGMPMYWPGYYPPHMQQPPQKPHAPLIPPLPITSTLQESTPPTSSESSIVTTATATTSTATASLDLLSSISPSTIMPASSLPPLFDAHLASNASLDLNALLPPSNILSSLSSSSSSPSSSSLVSHLANQFITSSVPLSLGFLSSSSLSSSSSSSVIPTPTPMPLLATPRMLQTGVLPSPVKNAEQSSIESSTSTPVPTAPLTTSQATSQTQTFNQEPLLPLPAVVTTQERRYRQGNGVVLHSNYVRRGRGRGRGNVVASYQAKRFTEEFDFDAMNAKFKKFGALDELNDKADGEECEDVGSNDDDDDDEAQYKLKNSNMPESPKKPIYVKDDFFDSLSCDALDRAASTERVKMSQLRKIDTETFGSFSSRYRGGQGGRGYGYRGGSRRGGSYHGGRSWGGIGRGNVYGRRG